MVTVVIICLCFDKYSFPEDQHAELVTIASHTGKALRAHYFNLSTQKPEADGSL